MSLSQDFIILSFLDRRPEERALNHQQFITCYSITFKRVVGDTVIIIFSESFHPLD